MRGKTITIHLGRGRIGSTGALYQYDYGQHLIIAGCELPISYKVHFSNEELGRSKAMLGNADGVDIPDEYLESGQDIHVWVYIIGEDHAETEYQGIIRVIKRAQPTDEEPSPTQQGIIDQAIATLNEAIETTGENVEIAIGAAQSAIEARNDADAAQRLASAAQRAAETAQAGAESARDAAAGSAAAALAQANRAETQAGISQAEAESAARDADRAEQAANTAGYMEVEIIDGRLVYTKTEMIHVDFELVDGHLIMEVA